jgi:hypothetical protein
MAPILAGGCGLVSQQYLLIDPNVQDRGIIFSQFLVQPIIVVNPHAMGANKFCGPIPQSQLNVIGSTHTPDTAAKNVLKFHDVSDRA